MRRRHEHVQPQEPGGKKEDESFAEKLNFLRLMGVVHPPLSRKEKEML
jgi:hypothetical protein